MTEQMARWFAYDFVTIRLVPRVHRGEFHNMGVIVFSAQHRFLAGRFVDEADLLSTCLGRLVHDPALLVKYLHTLRLIVRGDRGGGPIAALSPSQRFHWLSAPRSDIIQPGSVHHGRCRDLEGCVADLFAQLSS